MLSTAWGPAPLMEDQAQPKVKTDTVIDTASPYHFHLYLVLRKKHYQALLTVRDTNDTILITRQFDSLLPGRNFFNIPMKKKLPPVVLWDIKGADLDKKGRMPIH